MTQAVTEGLNARVHSAEENTDLQTVKSRPFTLAWGSKHMPHIPGTSRPSSGVVMVFLLLFARLYLGKAGSPWKKNPLHNRHNIYSSENVCLTSSAGCPLLWQLRGNLSVPCALLPQRSGDAIRSFASAGCFPLICLLFSIPVGSA